LAQAVGYDDEQDLGYRPAHGLRGWHPEQVLQRRAGVKDRAVGVDRQREVGGVLDQGPESLLVVA
jgi:hypothetical protein